MRTMIVSLLTVFLTGVTACGNPASSPDVPNVAIEDGASVPEQLDDGQIQTLSDRQIDTTTGSVENARSPDTTASYNCRPCIGGQQVCCWKWEGKRYCEMVGC